MVISIKKHMFNLHIVQHTFTDGDRDVFFPLYIAYLKKDFLSQ